MQIPGTTKMDCTPDGSGYRCVCACGFTAMCSRSLAYHKCPAPPGPGTELKALLSRIGITASPTCSCNKRAKVMDEKGCDWCEHNIDQIDGWLAEEARKRGLPYLSLAGRALIRLAVRRARKKGIN